MVLFVIAVLMVALVAQGFSLGRGMEGIGYRQEATPSTVEPDQVFHVTTTLENGTKRLIPFLRLVENLPREIVLHTQGLKVDTGIGLGRDDDLRIIATVYLMPLQRLKRQVSVSLPQRGRYFLRGASLRHGDFLGLREEGQGFTEYREIVVIPRAAPLPVSMDTFGGFLGDVSVNRFILEDPVLTLGFREYTMREPQKMISWTQSARRGQLMVRKYDYTLELSVTILLNVEYHRMEEPEEKLEYCFSLARSACEYLEEKGIKYDFITNADASGALGHWSTVGEGLGYHHLSTILEGLGRASYTAVEPFADTLERTANRAQQGRSYILITPQALPTYTAGLDRLRELTRGSVQILDADGLMVSHHV